jgi:hypothetical protein
MSIDPAASAQASTPTVTVTAQSPIKAFDDDNGPSFHDVLDIINPLQHIPIINTIYRHLTGDEEGAVADVGGGALWMGPVGLVGALADLAVKSESGKSIGDNILSWLGLDDDDDTAKAAEAQTQQQVQQQAQQTAQQTAAVTAPLPAITAQTLSPLPARGNDRKDDRRDAGKDAPARAGDFMVFGAAGSSQPQALTPTALTPQPPSQQADAGPSRQGNYMVFGGSSQQQSNQQQAPAASVTVAADTPGASRQGQYMVFGAATAAATTAAQPVQLAQASVPTAQAAAAAYAAPMQMTPASASVTPRTPLPTLESAPANSPAATQAAAVAAATPAGGGPANLSPMPARSFAPPMRRTQVTPNALPMPTTGPGAVPGRATQTQALPAMSPADASWFSQAVNAGLDKYAAAQKLANQDNMPAAAAAGAQADTTIH